ncbi:MAG: RHS repeat-associated core domain-containing protein [Fimbriiglobus sp.]
MRYLQLGNQSVEHEGLPGGYEDDEGKSTPLGTVSLTGGTVAVQYQPKKDNFFESTERGHRGVFAIDDRELAPTGQANDGARPYDGVTSYQHTDFVATGYDLTWGHRREWVSDQQYNLNNSIYEGTAEFNGRGWNVTEFPRLVREGQSIRYRVGADWLVFDLLQNDQYRPRFGGQDTLTRNRSAGTFTLSRQDGTQIVFDDFNSALPRFRRGQFKRIVSPGGIVTEVTEYIASPSPNGSSNWGTTSTNGQIGKVERTQTIGDVIYKDRFTYTWTGYSPTYFNDWDYRHISSVSWDRMIDRPAPRPDPVDPEEEESNPNPRSIEWLNLRRVHFTYDYQQPYFWGHYPAAPNDRFPDLIAAKIYDGEGSLIDGEYYVYEGDSISRETNRPALKYVVKHSVLVQAGYGETSPQTIPHGVLDNFSSRKFEFSYPSGTLTSITRAGAGSAATFGQGKTSYTYDSKIDVENGMNGVKATHTIENAEGLTSIVYQNAYGLTMGTKTTMDKSRIFNNYARFDGDGRITVSASPSGITQLAPESRDLIDFTDMSSDNFVAFGGAIAYTIYASQTNATASQSGDVRSLPRATFLSNGSRGGLLPQSEFTYWQIPASGTLFTPLAEVTTYDRSSRSSSVYPSSVITSTDYVWPASWGRPQTITTTSRYSSRFVIPGVAEPPIVSIRKQNQTGTQSWSVDPQGYVNTSITDIITGGVLQTVQDANTSVPGITWTGPAPVGNRANLVSNFKLDKYGRTILAVDPNGIPTKYSYDSFRRTNWTYPGWDLEGPIELPLGVTRPAITVSRVDWWSGFTETYTIPSPEGQFPYGEQNPTAFFNPLLSMSKTYTNLAGQVTKILQYTNFEGLYYTPEPHNSWYVWNGHDTMGQPGVHYLQTSYGYDQLGRQYMTTTPDGVSMKSSYDKLGRVISQEKMAVPFAWTTVNEYVFDQNKVGDGNVTLSTTYPGFGQVPLETATLYDWRNRPVFTKSGKEGTGLPSAQDAKINRPLTRNYYDNLNRVIRSDVYDGDGVTPVIDEGVPQNLPTTLLRGMTTNLYDYQSRVVATAAYGANQVNGTITATPAISRTWYDLRGLPITTMSPEGRVQKTVYDGVGREVESFSMASTNSVVFDPANPVAKDAVISQSYRYYGGTLLLGTEDREAIYSPTLFYGRLNAANSRPHYVTNYYDPLGRSYATVDSGVNTHVVVPGVYPTPNENQFVTYTGYDFNGRVAVTQDAQGVQSEQTYDPAGRITSMTAASNSAQPMTTVYTYNSRGQQESVISPGNRISKTFFNPWGQVSASVNNFGTTFATTTTYESDWLGRNLSTTTPDGVVSKTTYNVLGAATGSIQAANTPDPIVTNSILDVFGRTQATQDDSGAIWETRYDDIARSTIALEPTIDGVTRWSSSTSDRDGFVRWATNALSQTAQTIYDGIGRMITSIDPFGATDQVKYNVDNVATVMINSLGEGVRSAVDFLNRPDVVVEDGITMDTNYETYFGTNAALAGAVGSVESVENPAKPAKTKTFTDPLGRVVRVAEQQKGNYVTVSSSTYYATGELKTTTDGKGIVTRFNYNDAGQLIEQIVGFGLAEDLSTKFTYDAAGRLQTTTHPTGRVDKLTYDAYGRTKSEIIGLGTAFEAETKYEYDNLGRVNKVTDDLGHATTTLFDAAGRTIAITDANGSKTSFGYDELGRQLWIQDASNNKTSWEYLDASRTLKETDPFGKVSTTQFNSEGQTLSTIDRMGHTREFGFDGNGRVNFEIWNASSGGKSYGYDYDERGNLRTAGEYTFEYNDRDLVAIVNAPLDFVFTMDYDANGNRDFIADNKGTNVSSQYDSLNRLKKRSLLVGGSLVEAEWTYQDHNGLLNELKRSKDADHVTTTYGYDAVGRVNDVSTSVPNGATQRSAVSLDSIGRVTSRTVDTKTQSFSYDAVNQITNNNGQSITYDKTGNRTSQGSQAPVGNRLVTDGLWSYTYNDNGQVTTKLLTGDVKHWEYVYDVRGQLESAKFYDSKLLTKGGNVAYLALEVSYEHDVFGNRLRRWETVYDGDGGSKASVESFVYDGWDTAKPGSIGSEHFDVWAEQEGKEFDYQATSRLFGPGFDEPIAKVGPSSSVSWYLADYQGSIVDIVDQAGNEIEQRQYDGFGVLVSGTQTDRYGYVGREWDAGLKLQYNRARMYDPAIGRWLSEDPMSFAAGDPNLSRYVGNNATSGTDPSGNWLFVRSEEKDKWANVFENNARMMPVTKDLFLVVPKRTKENHDAIANRLRHYAANEEQLREILAVAYGSCVTYPVPDGDLQDFQGGIKNGCLLPGALRNIYLNPTDRYLARSAYRDSGGGFLLSDDPIFQQAYEIMSRKYYDQLEAAQRQNSGLQFRALTDQDLRRIEQEDNSRKIRERDVHYQATNEWNRLIGRPFGVSPNFRIMEESRQLRIRDDEKIWNAKSPVEQFMITITIEGIMFALGAGIPSVNFTGRGIQSRSFTAASRWPSSAFHFERVYIPAAHTFQYSQAELGILRNAGTRLKTIESAPKTSPFAAKYDGVPINMMRDGRPIPALRPTASGVGDALPTNGITMEDLLMGNFRPPGEAGVVIITNEQHRVIYFSDLFRLGEKYNNGFGAIEFTLTREMTPNGSFVRKLYSGVNDKVWRPNTVSNVLDPGPVVRAYGHNHPSRIPHPSPGDMTVINNEFLDMLIRDPNALPPNSRIIWGAGDTSVTLYYPNLLR